MPCDNEMHSLTSGGAPPEVGEAIEDVGNAFKKE
jgi:hypothetical protein